VLGVGFVFGVGFELGVGGRARRHQGGNGAERARMVRVTVRRPSGAAVR
jgi:hypothetical protein